MTVGILAAVYFFVVRPALDTTENISRETNQSIQNSIQNSGINDLNDINGTIDDVNRKVQREIRKSIRQSQQQGNTDKLIRCIQRVRPDVDKMQRCSRRFQ